MKFRILRHYDEYQPQVCDDPPMGIFRWRDIGKYICYTIEEAKKVCSDYKKMCEDPIVEEFEL